MKDPNEIVQIGRSTLASEARAIASVENRLGKEFTDAVMALHACRGRIIVTGMGKSGHVARKIAATLTSTGTRAIFLHAAEALHGDLGIIAPDDVVIALSYSGQTEEVVRVAEYAITNGNMLIAMTAETTSPLAERATIILDTHIDDEGTILNIVPTLSTTVQMALGDAIAGALMHLSDFDAKAFARLHPGGYIERRINEKENK